MTSGWTRIDLRWVVENSYSKLLKPVLTVWLQEGRLVFDAQTPVIC